MELLYRRHRFSREIISHTVWLYHRFTLSFRDPEHLLAERATTVFYEAIQSWYRKFGPAHARTPRRRQARLGDIWHVDELFITIHGPIHNLFRVGRHHFKAIHYRVLRERVFTHRTAATCAC